MAALSHAPLLECRRPVICCRMRLIIVFALDRARSLTNLQVENNTNEDKSLNETFFSPTMKTNSQLQFPKHVIFIKCYCRFFCSEFIYGAHVHDLESSRVAISHFYFRIQIMSHKILFYLQNFQCSQPLNSKSNEFQRSIEAFCLKFSTAFIGFVLCRRFCFSIE